jgi:hypothetical protein
LFTFWFESWVWALLGLAVTFGIWLLVLVLTSWLSMGPADKYALRRRETILAGAPAWMSRLTGPELPALPKAGANLARLDREISRKIRTADRSSRTLFALPTGLACLMGIGGAVQALFTLAVLLIYTQSLLSWVMFALAAFAATMVPFTTTAWVREYSWSGRMPFEWMYLRASYWAVRNVKRSERAGGRRPDARVVAEYLDPAEWVLAGRFRERGVSETPSVRYAAVEWRLRIDPMLRRKGQFIVANRRQHSSPFVLDWLETGAQVIRTRPRRRPESEAQEVTTDFHLATGAPGLMSGPFGATTALLALVVVFSCCFVVARMQEGGSHPHLSDLVTRLTPVLNELAAAAAILVAVVTIFSLATRRRGAR